jgi:radical SAM superfamily enzyme YgiQ (UPF0313 family)
MSVDDLRLLRDAGLNRIHVGLESGSDEVLRMMKKGATKKLHIKAGFLVKSAGIELSEYIMPGLGGNDLSEIHILETADALTHINPDFIRLRPLALPETVPLYEDYRQGRFSKCTDKMMAEELLLLLQHLKGSTSVIISDHILNLFADLEGKLPEDKTDMIMILQNFLSMDSYNQQLYQLGRRTGLFSSLRDMENTLLQQQVIRYYHELKNKNKSVDTVTDELMKRFI